MISLQPTKGTGNSGMLAHATKVFHTSSLKLLTPKTNYSKIINSC